MFIGAKCTYGNGLIAIDVITRAKDWSSNFPVDCVYPKGRRLMILLWSFLQLSSLIYSISLSLSLSLSLPLSSSSSSILIYIQKPTYNFGPRYSAMTPRMKKVPEKFGGKSSYWMKYFTGSIVSLDVFRLIGRCTVSADVETSILFPTDRTAAVTP